MKHLLVWVLLAAVQETPSDKCAISGKVVDVVTGQPLNKVDIQVEGLGSDETPTPFTTTDVKGNFVLVDLPPGQYRLKGQRNGYLDTYYSARRAGGSGTPIRLEAGQRLDGIEFKLVPFGVIAGTVREQDGEPLARVQVRLYRLVFDEGRRRVTRVGEDTRTDDLGQYRITGLEPGKYYVQAEPEGMAALGGTDHSAKSDSPREILLPALYPGVQDQAAARPVEVTGGARVTGIDIVLSRSTTQRVTGHVSVGAGAKLAGVELKYAGAAGGDAGFRFTAKRKPNGDFEFPAVPPGSFIATAIAEPPRKPTTDPWEMIFYQSSYKAHVSVQVGTVPVENVQLVLGAGAEVEGHISVEGDGKDAKMDRGRVTFDNGADDPTQAMVHEDLSFNTGLGRGHYSIDWRPNLGYVVRRIQLEGKDITEDGLTISGAGKVQLEIVVAKEGAEIEGTVADKDDKPVAGAIVVLVPEARLRGRASLFQQAETDQSGRFKMDTIPPGTYKLFAWDDVDAGIWWDPDFLKNYEDKGVPVTLKPRQKQSVKLPLIAVQEQ